MSSDMGHSMSYFIAACKTGTISSKLSSFSFTMG